MSENKTIETISAIQSLCKERRIKKYGIAIEESRHKGDEYDRVTMTLFVPRPDRSYEKREAKRQEALKNDEVEC